RPEESGGFYWRRPKMASTCHHQTPCTAERPHAMCVIPPGGLGQYPRRPDGRHGIRGPHRRRLIRELNHGRKIVLMQRDGLPMPHNWSWTGDENTFVSAEHAAVISSAIDEERRRLDQAEREDEVRRRAEEERYQAEEAERRKAEAER